MSDVLAWDAGRAVGRDRTRTLFGQTMGLVAATAGLFALGAYLGRGLSYRLGFVWFVAAFACLLLLRVAARRSEVAATALLFAFGVLLGLAVAPVTAYYAQTDPRALWQAGGATALFMAGFGAAGYTTRRDLSRVGRISFGALLALIVFGIVMIFVRIPGGELLYSVLGLVVFAGLVLFDFQRLRRTQNLASAPAFAASIFLDVLNVFLFFLQIFGGNR